MNAVPYIVSMCPYGYTLSAYTCYTHPYQNDHPL